jgi:hypothetical protein
LDEDFREDVAAFLPKGCTVGQAKIVCQKAEPEHARRGVLDWPSGLGRRDKLLA